VKQYIIFKTAQSIHTNKKFLSLHPVLRLYSALRYSAKNKGMQKVFMAQKEREYQDVTPSLLKKKKKKG